jgi:cytochrome o ubiquinol oxidase subunit 3
MSTASANEPAASAWREHASAPAFARGEVGVLLFLAGEVMFFAGLVAAALVLRSADAGWNAARESLALPPALAGSALLVASSVVLELSLRRARRGNVSALRATLVLSALLGAAFVALQGFEYRTLLAHDLRWTSGVFGSCFYVLTALHALHVCAGALWLALVACTAGPRVERATLASWYWHLVGAVWIGLFLFFYVS